MIHQISLFNRLLADFTIQSISSKSYVNPHIVEKAKTNQPQKAQLKIQHLFLWGFIYNRGGVFINRGKRLSHPCPFAGGRTYAGLKLHWPTCFCKIRETQNWVPQIKALLQCVALRVLRPVSVAWGRAMPRELALGSGCPTRAPA